VLRVLWAGKTRDSLLGELVRRYADRIRHCAPFRVEEVRAGRSTRKGEAAAAEGERFLARLPRDGTVVALDAGGRRMTTEAFAGWLEGALSRGSGEVAFIVGGHEGLSPAVRERATATLALSEMTFTHEMARVLLLEQIYRAFTILRGEPYHH
jgi:23S rRNA (pseudouridine1915-N3)-methyltransferase